MWHHRVQKESHEYYLYYFRHVEAYATQQAWEQKATMSQPENTTGNFKGRQTPGMIEAWHFLRADKWQAHAIHRCCAGYQTHARGLS